MTDLEEQKKEVDQGLSEHSRLRTLIYPFKLTIFPFKAFRDMIHNPSTAGLLPGLLLVIALYVVTQVGILCVRASKIFLDSGTESTSLLGADLFETLASLLPSSLSFILSWVTYAAIVFLVARFFSQKKNFPLNSFLVIFGYIFSVLVISNVITAVLASFLPEIHFDSSLWYSRTPEDLVKIYDGFNAAWGPSWVIQAANYLGLGFMFWMVGLSAILVNVSHKIRLMAAIVLSFTAYFASMLITAFLSELL